MIIYNYISLTGEYIGTNEAKESPREPGVFLIPANAVGVAPMTVADNEVAVWDGTKWIKQADYRDKVYYDKTTKEKHEIKEIGIAPDVNWTDVAPNDPDAEWDGSGWVVPFSVLVERKKASIAQAHKEYITGSINTSLGYPMQFNMSDSLMVRGAIELAQASGATTIYLTDAEDVTHHDVPLADAQAVFLEMTTAFAEAHAKKQLLRQLIESATTQEQLDSINW